jgi:chromosome segregation ATPase
MNTTAELRRTPRINGGIMAALAFLGLGATESAFAQVERTGGGESQKIMQQYQQLAAERTALQAQVAQLKKDLDTAHADLAAMKQQRDALRVNSGNAAAAVSQANSSRQTAERDLEQSRLRMSELVARFRETAQNLKTVEQENARAKKSIAERDAAFDACADHNFQLYEISREVLDRYEHVGFYTKVSAAEPFTRITRTRIENLVDDYRARAEELRVKTPAH